MPYKDPSAKAEWRRRNREAINAQRKEWRGRKLAEDPLYADREREKAREQQRRERERRPEAPPRHCRRCGRPFLAAHAAQRYCGRDCRERAGRSGEGLSRCAICSAAFVRSHSTQKTCSGECGKRLAKATAAKNRARHRDDERQRDRARYYEKPDYRAAKIARSANLWHNDPEYRKASLKQTRRRYGRKRMAALLRLNTLLQEKLNDQHPVTCPDRL